MKYSEKQKSEYRKQINDIVNASPDTFVTKLKSKKFRYLYDFVIDTTPLLNDSCYNMATKCYWVIHDIQDWKNPLVSCPHCHNPLKGKNAKVLHGYRRPHCSRSCSQADVNVYSKIVEKKRKKYGSACNAQKGIITSHRNSYYKLSSNDNYEQLITPIDQFLENFNNSKFLLTYKCNQCGNIFKSRSKYFYVNNERHNARCYHCYPTIHTRSLIEIELYEFCEQICNSLGIEILHNDRTIAKLKNKRPLDFDISIPSLKLLIEMNGQYYHSQEFMLIAKQKNLKKKSTFIQRLDKTIIAENHGYKLIHIEEYVWKNEKSRIKMFLESMIKRTFKFDDKDILIVDRSLHNKNDKPFGYELISEIPPTLQTMMKFHFFDCGQLIYKRIKPQSSQCSSSTSTALSQDSKEER